MAYRAWLQREHGLCSDPTCDEPIMGWCQTCQDAGPFKAPKWCDLHLLAHLRDQPDHTIYWPWEPDPKVNPYEKTGTGGAA